MTNDERRTGRDISTELLRLQAEREQTDRELMAAIEQGDQPEAKQLRYKMTGLMRDIAALRFDLMVEQASAEPPRPPTGGGPGWMGLVEGPRRKDG